MAGSVPSRPLGLSPDQFESFAHRFVGVAAELIGSLDGRQTVPSTSGAETVAAFDQPAPEVGLGDAVLDDQPASLCPAPAVKSAKAGD